ncbi:MAG: sulfotransferase domain-containing protein [Bacteroidota bacterium]
MQNIAIFGVPRSGTSWLGQIFNSSPNVVYRYQPIFAYSFEDSLTEESSTKEIQEFHTKLLTTDDDFVCQKKNISGNKTPKFNKRDITHLVWKEVRYLNIIENLIVKSTIKVIGIIRHPCGVLKSWMNAPKEFNNKWDIKEEWRHANKKNTGKHEFYGFQRWIESTKIFLELENEYPNQFKKVNYEALLNDPILTVSELMDFAGLDYTNQTEDFLLKSTQKSSNDPYDVFRKDKSGQEWRDELPKSIINKILDDDCFVELSGYLRLESDIS